MIDPPTYSEWLNSIKESKEDLWSNFDGDADSERDFSSHYSPNLIVRGLVTEMNLPILNILNSIHPPKGRLGMPYLRPLDKKMHYHFLLRSIPKGQTYKSVSMSKEAKRRRKMDALWKEVQRTKGVGGFNSPR